MTMGIEWGPNEQMFASMESLFLSKGKDALTMNHYQLYKDYPQFDFAQWRSFLCDPRVNNYIQTEFETIKEVELRKIIADIAGSKSVGQAQIINALARLLEPEDHKDDGPAFIYCYVPLTEPEKHADNVQQLDHDPFLRRSNNA
jgi:hypothetical protein